MGIKINQNTHINKILHSDQHFDKNDLLPVFFTSDNRINDIIIPITYKLTRIIRVVDIFNSSLIRSYNLYIQDKKHDVYGLLCVVGHIPSNDLFYTLDTNHPFCGICPSSFYWHLFHHDLTCLSP